MSEPDQLIAYMRAGGSDARDIRDAVHEWTHALDTSLPFGQWDRESIHGGVLSLSRQERAETEVRARAAEWLACEMAGVPHDVDGYLIIAQLEAAKSGFRLPLGLRPAVERVKREEAPDVVSKLARAAAAWGQLAEAS